MTGVDAEVLDQVLLGFALQLDAMPRWPSALDQRPRTVVPVAHPLSIEQNGWGQRQAVQVKFNFKTGTVFIEKLTGLLECIILGGIRHGYLVTSSDPFQNEAIGHLVFLQNFSQWATCTERP